MLKRLAFGLFLLGSSFAHADDTDLKYAEAYAKAEKEKKPLVVLIGAEWCASCKTMKSETIVEMKKEDDFKEVVFTVVDVDNIDGEILEGLLIVDEKTKQKIRTYPQIVVFNKRDDAWKKFGLPGRQSRPRVLELLKKAMFK